LFLMLAVLWPRAGAGWRTPVLFAIIAVPVAGVLASNALTRPFRVDGSAFAQTERLDHPAALRGLMVAPTLARTQAELDQALARLPPAAHKAPAIYGSGRPGLAVLVGSSILGAPLYIVGYPNVETWNCTLARFSLREGYRLIVGMDLPQKGAALQRCLPDYVVGPPVAQVGPHVLSLITPR